MTPLLAHLGNGPHVHNGDALAALILAVLALGALAAAKRTR